MSMKFNFKENESVKGRLDLKIRRKAVLVENGQGPCFDPIAT